MEQEISDLKVQFKVDHIETTEIIEQHFDFEEKPEAWLCFLNQFLDFTIVYDKNSGQYFGIDPSGAL